MPHVTFQYKKILEQVRDAVLSERVKPGTPARIEILNKGPRPHIIKSSHRTKARMYHWLSVNYPMDMWRLHSVEVPGTWKDREIWVEFHGVAEHDRQLAEWSKKNQRRSTNAEIRAFLESVHPEAY